MTWSPARPPAPTPARTTSTAGRRSRSRRRSRLTGGSNYALSFNWYLAHGSNATSADYLRVFVNGTQVFQQLGVASNRNGAWAAASVDLTAFAGQTVRIRVEAADAATASLVEAAVDDLKVTRT